MKIEAMEIPGQGPDKDQTTAWVKIGDVMAIEIQAVGTAQYRWKGHAMLTRVDDVRFKGPGIDQALDPVMGPRDNGGYYGPESFGRAGVYMEPKTMAHAVYDVVMNA